MPVVQLLRALQSLGLTLVGLVEELEYRLDGLGRQDDPGAVGKDQTVFVGRNGEVGPHEIANGRLGTHWFDPGGYYCSEGRITFINKVDQVS